MEPLEAFKNLIQNIPPVEGNEGLQEAPLPNVNKVVHDLARFKKYTELVQTDEGYGKVLSALHTVYALTPKQSEDSRTIQSLWIEVIEARSKKDDKEFDTVADEIGNDLISAEDKEKIKFEEGIKRWLDQSVKDSDTAGRISEKIVAVYEGRSSVLDLSGLEIKTLPPELMKLEKLVELNVSNNILEALPTDIGKMTQLKKLNLSTNGIKTLPHEIGNLTQLEEMSLSYSEISTLPTTIGQLKNLKKLFFFSHQPVELPKEIGQLTNLQELHLSIGDNKLPEEIVNLKKLEVLNLSFSGDVPPQVYDLSGLKKLTLGLPHNKTTTLPKDIKKLGNLEELTCSAYRAKLSLPEEIWQLPKLQKLDLSNTTIDSWPYMDKPLDSLRELNLKGIDKLPLLPQEIINGKGLERIVFGNKENLTELCPQPYDWLSSLHYGEVQKKVRGAIFDIITRGEITSENDPISIDWLLAWFRPDDTSHTTEIAWLESRPNLMTKLLCKALESTSPNSASLLELYIKGPSYMKGANGFPFLKEKPYFDRLMSTAIANNHSAAIESLLSAWTYDNQQASSFIKEALSNGFTRIAETIFTKCPDEQKDSLNLEMHVIAQTQLVDYEKNKFKETLALSWLLDHGANVNMQAPDGQSLIEKVIDTIGQSSAWPLLTQLVEKGADIPPRSMKPLISAALKRQQTYPLTLIENKIKTAINEFTFPWNALLKLEDEVFLQRLLDVLATVTDITDSVDNAGDTLLHQAIIQKRYPLAAFLVSRGFDAGKENNVQLTPAALAKKNGVDFDAIKTYADALQNGSPQEKELRERLHLSNVGHLVGDGFLKGLKSDLGYDLEGNTPSSSTGFFAASCNAILEKHKDKLSSEFQDGLKALAPKLKEMQRLSLKVESAFMADGGRDTAFYQLSVDLKKKIRELPINEFLLIPWGYPRHAMAIQCTRIDEDKLRFTVFNTGGGAEFHRGKKGDKLFVDTVKNYIITQEDIESTALTEVLFQPQILGSRNPSLQFDAKDVYAMLEPYAEPERDKDAGTWMAAQRSGTCSFRVILALVRHNLEKKVQTEKPDKKAAVAESRDYKTFKSLLTNDVLKLTLEQNKGLVQHDRALGTVFSYGFPTAFRKLLKRVALEKEGLLQAEFDDMLREKIKERQQQEGVEQLSAKEIKPTQKKEGRWLGKFFGKAPGVSEPPALKTLKKTDDGHSSVTQTFKSWLPSWAGKGSQGADKEHFPGLEKECKVELEKEYEEAKSIYKNFQGQLKSVASNKTPTATPAKTMTPEIKEALEKVRKKEALTPPVSPKSIEAVRLLPTDVTEMKNKEDFKKWLGNRIAYAEYQKNDPFCVPFLTDTLRQVGRFATGWVTFSDISTKMTEKECADCWNDIEALCKQLFNLTYQQSESGNHSVKTALTFGLATAWQLAEAIEGKSKSTITIRSWGLSDKELQTLAHPSFPNASPLDSETVADYQRLADFFKKNTASDAKRAAGFFEVFGKGYDLCLVPGTAEYDYTEKDAKRITDWKLADKVYEVWMEKESNRGKQVPKNLWRLHYHYAYGLPKHFRRLVPLAMMAKLRDPFDEHAASLSGNLIPYIYDGKIQFGPKDLDFDRVKKLTENERKTPIQPDLPEDRGALKLRPDSSYDKEDKPFHTFLFLEPKELRVVSEESIKKRRENTLIAETVTQNRELEEIRTACSEDFVTGMQIPNLLCYFDEHKMMLLRQDARVFFRDTLWQEGRFKKALDVNTDMGYRLLKFLDNTYFEFQDYLNQGAERQQCLEAMCFLLEQRQRVLCHIGDFYSDTRSEMIATRQALIKSLAEADYQAPILQQHLRLALIESYRLKASTGRQPLVLDIEDVNNLVRGICKLRKLHLDHKQLYKRLPKSLHSAAKNLLQERIGDIRSVMQNKENSEAVQKLLLSVMTLYSLPSAGITWNIDDFPIARSSDGSYEVNVLSGTLKNNGNEFGAAPWQCQPLIREALGYMEMKWCQVDEDHYESRDRVSKVTLLSKEPGAIYRDFGPDGIFIYVPKDQWAAKLRIPSFEEKADWQVWQNVSSGLVYLMQKNQVKYQITPSGHFIFPTEGLQKQWEWIDCASTDGLQEVKAFHPNAMVWKEVTPAGAADGEIRLQFPHYVDSLGTPFEFVRKTINVDGQSVLRWVWKSNPHLFISDDQSLKGNENFHHFLILENSDGDKEAIIPNRTFTALGGIGNDQKPVKERLECLRCPMKGGEIQLSSPDINAHLAYLHLAYASRPEHYRTTMKYLEGAGRFEAYSAAELKTLGQIFTLSEDREAIYEGPENAALRLYAWWLVADNFRRNPVVERVATNEEKENRVPYLDATPEEWALYCLGDTNKIRDNLLENYRSREHLVSHDLRLEKHIEDLSLVLWDSSLTEQKPQQLPPGGELSAARIFETSKDTKGFQTRPGKKFKKAAKELYRMATSDENGERKHLKEILASMRYDTYGGNREIAIMLEASSRLKDRIDNDPARADAEFLDKSLKRMLDENFTRDWKTEELDALTTALVSFSEKVKPVAPEPDNAQSTVVTLPPSPKLPDDIKKSNLGVGFGVLQEADRDFAAIYNSYFQQKEVAEVAGEGLEFTNPPGADPLVEKSVGRLNEELRLGRERNQKDTTHVLKENTSIEEVIGTQRQSLAASKDTYEKDAANLKKQILKLANKKPSRKALSPRLKVKAARLAKEQSYLTMGELKGTFLQSDMAGYQQLNDCLDADDAKKLHGLINEYLQKSIVARQYSDVIQTMDKLSSKEMDSLSAADRAASKQRLIEEIGLKLFVKTEVGKREEGKTEPEDPAAFLVFEHELGINLYEHQVAGLRKMMALKGKQLPNLFLQRIQGGGKTLVFGHLLALLKADGYHLSIHVPPTAHYATAIYDMARRSKRLFGQKERTLVFDDHPAHFTQENLQRIYDTLHMAIINREYVTISKESLQAMEAKWHKIQLDSTATPAEKAALPLLKKSLNLLRDRGVFTLDEAHQALDFNKELNMPYGISQGLNKDQIFLIKRVLKWTMEAKATEESQVPLCPIRENRQSQMTEGDWRGVRGYVTAKIFECLDPNKVDEDSERLRRILGWNDVDDSKKVALTSYIIGADDTPPDFITKTKEADITTADHIVLLRQLIGKDWLSEPLTKSASEHFGRSELEGVTKTAIPYVANMKPSEGSEFSDPVLMTIYTFIDYAANGLDSSQAKELVQWMRKLAEQQKNTAKADGIAVSFRDTPAAKRFLEATGLTLFELNIDDLNVAERVRQAFEQNRPETIDLLYDFVDEHPLSEVKIYNDQVSVNGQNLVSMSQTTNGYTASYDNPHILPYKADFDEEKGTNGRSVDLFLRQNNDLWVVQDNNPDSLFTDLIDKHEQSGKISAIIDAGSHFRGMRGKDVAEKIGEHLRQDLRGILFFDETSGRPCFMPKGHPERTKQLSGSTPDVLAQETGLEPKEYFVYLDQDHITGTDLVFPPDARAVLTTSEHTKIHEDCQAARRLRELHLGQRVIFAVNKGSLDKMKKVVGKPKVTDVQIGEIQADDAGVKTFDVKDLILFHHLNEVLPHPDQNLFICMQKMENAARTMLRDKLLHMDNPQEEKTIYEKVGTLFHRSVFIDLWEKYAQEHAVEETPEYLKGLINDYLNKFHGILKPGEMKALEQQLKDIVYGRTVDGKVIERSIIDDIKPMVETPVPHREATQVQFKEQKQEVVQEQQNVMEQQQEQEREQELKILNNNILAKHLPVDLDFPEICKSKKFVMPSGKIGYNDRYERTTLDPTNASVGQLSAAFKLDGVARGYKNLKIPENVLLTSNFAQTFETRIDLCKGFRKTPAQFLLIYDDNDWSNRWKVLLCDQKDIDAFTSMRSRNVAIVSIDGQIIKDTRELWDRSKGYHNSSIKIEARELISFVQLFAGKQVYLNTKDAQAGLISYLKKCNDAEKKAAYKFFTEVAMREPPPNFDETNLGKILKPF